MTRMKVWSVFVVLTAIGSSCWAQSNADLARENTALQNRVENLEKQVENLSARVGQENEPLGTTSGKTPLWSSLDIQFYGYIKADAAYDDSRTTSGNFVLWADNEAQRDDDDEFNMTANETRLGFLINGPKDGNMETSGRVEFDFFGNYAEENKAKIQMRHAYMQFLWPQEQFSILAGQTWDVISPLNPSTLNYTVLWGVGNIGYRRPQIRLTKDWDLSEETSLRLQGAVARTIGDDEGTTEAGEDAGFPSFQGRAALTFPWLAQGPTTFGVSGHWGQEEYDEMPSGHGEADSWSLNLDLLQPLCEKMTLKAELFTGENLNAYFGGIIQGVRPIKNGAGTTIGYDNEIATKGGWVALALGPWDKWSFNTGIGIDDVDAGDVNVGQRTLNRSIFGNAIYALNKHADVGLELSHWRTDYRGDGDADDFRVQAAFKYKF